MSFWTRYVLLKEATGVPRGTTLAAIEAKYGVETKTKIETELAAA